MFISPCCVFTSHRVNRSHRTIRESVPACAYDELVLHMQQRFAGQLFGFERA
jgi:hypothetical protein